MLLFSILLVTSVAGHVIPSDSAHGSLPISSAYPTSEYVQPEPYHGWDLDNAPDTVYETVSVNVSQPRDNAPLNKELAYYRLNGTNGNQLQLTHSFIPVSCGAVMSVHHTDPHVFAEAGSEKTPILLLNHGYPESAYIWRKITPEICSRVPCIVPDVCDCVVLPLKPLRLTSPPASWLRAFHGVSKRHR